MHKLKTTVVEIIEGAVEDCQFEIIGCPKDETCAVWHECKVEGCEPPEDICDAEEGEVRHGLEHRYIDYSWMTLDVPHNCGAYFITEWFDLEAAVKEHGPGEYTFEADYDGDNWQAVGFAPAGLDTPEQETP